MCRCCKHTSNIHERIANHDFMERMREFYGLAPLYIKDHRNKNIKKSVLAKIDHNLKQIQNKIDDDRYANVAQRLESLRTAPFDDSTTPGQYAAIMGEYHDAQKTEILEYLRAKGYSNDG